MKKSLILTTMLTATAISHADTTGTNIQYPFLAPNCAGKVIVTPANQQSVLFNEACTTAYLLPDRVGQIDVKNVDLYANNTTCTSLYNLEDAESKLNGQISADVDQLTKLAIDDSRRQKVLDDITKIQNLTGQLFNNYNKVSGGSAEVVLSASSDQQRMNKFMEANMQIFHDGLDVNMAPISESYISFNEPNAQLIRDGVLDFNIAGLQPANNPGPNMKVYRAGFDSTAALTLSMFGACPGKGKPAPSTRDLGLKTYPVVTYTVPMLAWAGYTAALDNHLAALNILRSFESKGQFSTDDSSTLDSVASGSNTYLFNVFNVGNKQYYTQQDSDQFFKALREASLKRLTDRLLEQMAVAGFVQLAQAPAPISAPPPGTITETHDGGVSCGGGFLGIGRTCIHRTYQVTIHVDSSAEQTVQKAANLNFTNTEIVQARETVPRFYTTTYQLNTAPAINTTN